jgi:hypothetical protein
MKKATFNIEFVRGDSYSLFGRVRTKVWDSETSTYVPGPYRDLTGWVGRAQVRATPASTTVLFTFDVELGDQQAAPGSFFIKAQPSDTAALPDNQVNAVWDLEWTSTTNEVITPIGGTVKLEIDVSR